MTSLIETSQMDQDNRGTTMPISIPNLSLERDRLLIYLNSLGFDPVISLEIALEVLKNKPLSRGDIFNELHRQLKERHLLELALCDLNKADLVSPPLNRSSMISEKMDISIIRMLGRMLAGGFKPIRRHLARTWRKPQS